MTCNFPQNILKIKPVNEAAFNNSRDLDSSQRSLVSCLAFTHVDITFEFSLRLSSNIVFSSTQILCGRITKTDSIVFGYKMSLTRYFKHFLGFQKWWRRQINFQTDVRKQRKRSWRERKTDLIYFSMKNCV